MCQESASIKGRRHLNKVLAQTGASTLEYALIISLISIVSILALDLLGSTINITMTNISAAL